MKRDDVVFWVAAIIGIAATQLTLEATGGLEWIAATFGSWANAVRIVTCLLVGFLVATLADRLRARPAATTPVEPGR